MAKIALLIGVSDYNKLTPLPAAINDIEALKRVLENPEIAGFDEVQLLKNPDVNRLRGAVARLFENRNREDLVLLFFSGHGIRDDAGYLHFAAVDTEKDVAVATSARTSEILHQMRLSRSKRQVMILDCCYSGAAVPGLIDKSAEVDVSSSMENLAVLAEVDQGLYVPDLGGEGRVVLTSSTSAQESFTDLELSVYTKFLVEGLETGAADEGGNGSITMYDLHKYVKQKVEAAASRMNPEFYPSRQGFEIILAKSQSDDPELQYRKEVERYIDRAKNNSARVVIYLENNKITENERFESRRNLDALRARLEEKGLTQQKADEIESSVLGPLKILESKKQNYRKAYVEDLKRDGYSLRLETREGLERYRRIIDLQHEYVRSIERQVHLDIYEERCRELGNRRAKQLPDELTVLRAKLEPHLTGNDANSLHAKYFPNVGKSSRKRITPWILVALVALGFAVSRCESYPEIPTPSPTATITDSSNQFDRISDVPNVPIGKFKYGGSTTWALLRQTAPEGGKILPAIQDVFPDFQLIYEKPPKGRDGSRTGISMLTEKQLDIAQSSDRLPAKEREDSARGFSLSEVEISKDAIAIIVNPESGITELTVEQVQKVYRGQITNWNKLPGGKNLPIQPYSRSLESGTTGFVQKNVFNGPPASNLEYVDSPTVGINSVKNDPQGIFFLSAPEVFNQDSIRDRSIVVLALKKDDSSLSISLDSDGNFELDQSIFQDGKYPLVRGLYVVYRNDKTEAEKAGKAYAAMLCTKQAQQLLEDLGYGRSDCK